MNRCGWFCVLIVIIGFLYIILRFSTIISYNTRPLWDYDLINETNRWKLIQNLGLFDAEKSVICQTHNFTVRNDLLSIFNLTRVAKVYDVFLFNCEWELLEIRLNELSSIVHKFVLIEAECTFSGALKSCSFQDMVTSGGDLFHRYNAFIHQISIFSPNGFCERHKSANTGFTGFAAENDLRSYAVSAAVNAGARFGDIFVFSDIDEIPRQQTLQLLQLCDFGSRIHLALDSYRYSFEHRLWPEIVFRSTVSVLGRLRPERITHRFTYETDLLLGDAGWHCSWCFRTAKEVIFKMKSYSHSDRISAPRLLDQKVIEEKFCSGDDPFEMLPEASSFSALVALNNRVKMQGVSHVPQFVARNADRFRYLLPGGCKNREEKVL